MIRAHHGQIKSYRTAPTYIQRHPYYSLLNRNKLPDVAESDEESSDDGVPRHYEGCSSTDSVSPTERLGSALESESAPPCTDGESLVPKTDSANSGGDTSDGSVQSVQSTVLPDSGMREIYGDPSVIAGVHQYYSLCADPGNGVLLSDVDNTHSLKGALYRSLLVPSYPQVL